MRDQRRRERAVNAGAAVKPSDSAAAHRTMRNIQPSRNRFVLKSAALRPPVYRPATKKKSRRPGSELPSCQPPCL
jgi:hypothetical protein